MRVYIVDMYQRMRISDNNAGSVWVRILGERVGSNTRGACVCIICGSVWVRIIAGACVRNSPPMRISLSGFAYEK